MDPNPSSSTAGFFQAPPQVENQYYEDIALRRALAFYLPSTIQSSIAPDLSRFGQKVLTRRVLNWTADAEKHLPFLRTWDAWGTRKDELVTSSGWRNLQDMGIAEGMVAIAYENKLAEHSRLYQFAKSASLPMQTRRVLEAAYGRLISRDEAWTSGQWMTERAGGSNVSGIETQQPIIPTT
ncbi:MAG: hypothetical protein M1830_004210 [Pleopsidium flavum]|nr:MAG: hypothetical protein M1830_004210 [Pleopsidium flavum]